MDKRKEYLKALRTLQENIPLTDNDEVYRAQEIAIEALERCINLEWHTCKTEPKKITEDIPPPRKKAYLCVTSQNEYIIAVWCYLAFFNDAGYEGWHWECGLGLHNAAKQIKRWREIEP